MIAVGDRMPEATLLEMTADGPSQVATADLFIGKTVALFAVPGAFTPTCHAKHVPSYVANIGALKEKGVDEVVCLSVNDPFVMGKWGEATGASAAGIRMLGDPESGLVKAMGLDFSAPPAGLIGRAKRFSALVKDGELAFLAVEENPGVAEATLAEGILAEL